MAADIAKRARAPSFPFCVRLRRCAHSPERNGFAVAGFTIVELITVVVLLGILSMVATSRMIRPSAFAPSTVTHGIVAETRIAQQRAMSRQDAVVSLTVDRLGDDWRLRLSTDIDGVIRTELYDVANTAIQAQSGAADLPLDAATALQLRFDTAGNLAEVTVGATPGDPSTGVSITVTGDSSRDVCVYSSGFAAEEVCA